MPGTIQVIRPHAQTANKRPGSLGHSFAASSMKHTAARSRPHRLLIISTATDVLFGNMIRG